jgi:hypothetical protein
MQKNHQVRSGESQCQCNDCRKRSSGISLPAVPPFQLVKKSVPVNVANPVIQRYEPVKKDQGKQFKVKRPGDSHFITATFVEEEEEGRGWYFRVGKGEKFLVANKRNIIPEGEEIKEAGGKGKSRSYYNELAFSKNCQFPGCGKSFKDPQDLTEHITSSHSFPKEKQYPYALFGGQSAISHSLIREGEGFKPLSTKTGDGFHSEWRSFSDRIPAKKPEKKPLEEDKRSVKRKKTEDTREKKKEEEDEQSSGFSFTTAMTDLMDSNSTSDGLFVTGDPHCALCSLTLNKAGLPVTYPTNANPATSPSYGVPSSAPNFNDIMKVFPKDADHKCKEHSTIEKDNFPKKIESRQSYNDRLRREYKTDKHKDDGEQQIKFMLQAIGINRERYNTFFGGLEEGETYPREELKEELKFHPIPKNPYTFDEYCPSPIRYKEEEEQEREVLSKRDLRKLIAAINKAFKKYDPDKIEIGKREEKYFDPVKENNCLITALNGGEPASYEDVLMIRYLIFQQLDIAYGKFLPASPEVIYIIAKTLEISDTQVNIYRDEESADQVFIISSDYNIIELQGDEKDDQEFEEATKNLDIDHSGGNHFSYRK